MRGHASGMDAAGDGHVQAAALVGAVAARVEAGTLVPQSLLILTPLPQTSLGPPCIPSEVSTSIGVVVRSMPSCSK